MNSRSSLFSQGLVNIATKMSLLLTIINIIMSTILVLTWKQKDDEHTSSVVIDSQRRQLDEFFNESLESTWRRNEVLFMRGPRYFLDPNEVKKLVPKVPLLQYPLVRKATENVVKRKFVEEKKLWQIAKNAFDESNHKQSGSSYGKQSPSHGNYLDVSDIYFSVRTTLENHRSRLPFLMKTWISLVPRQVRIVTDNVDETIKSLIQNFDGGKPEVILTDCPLYSQSKWALFCKVYWEFMHFLRSHVTEKWFCHFDDDTYVNIIALLAMLNDFDSSKPTYIGRSPPQTTITRVYKASAPSNKPEYIVHREGNHTETTYLAAFHFAIGGAGYCISKALAIQLKPYFEGPTIIQTAASISLPDDCVIGFIVTHLLKTPLVNSPVMHSHLDNFSDLSEDDVFYQVTFPIASKLSPSTTRNQTNEVNKKLDNDRPGQKGVEDSSVDKSFLKLLNFSFVQKFHSKLVQSLSNEIFR